MLVGMLLRLLATLTGLLVLSSAPLQASSLFDKFIDPTDGQFDTSGWLIDNKGFLPVPILITEPAVGAGIRVRHRCATRGEGTLTTAT